LTDFGTDISTATGLDPLFVPISGTAVALARRLQTARGGLHYDPDYGLDLRAWLNESFDAAGVARLQSAIAAEAAKDERIAAATAAVTLDPRRMVMTVRIAAVTALGPFRLVLSVDRVTTRILQVDQ
jgi:phage baseplate assembly protein W